MPRPKLLLAAAAASLGLPAPALAQHHGHHMPGMTMPAPVKKAPPKKAPAKKSVAKKPAVKKAVARKPAAKKAAPAKAPARKAAPRKPAARKATPRMPVKAPTPVVDPHAGHDMSGAPATVSVPSQPVDPHAGHQMPTASDPHAGHAMPPTEAAQDPHAGHAMAPTRNGTDLPAGTSAAPPAPTAHAADAVYGAHAMHMGRHHLATMHGAQKFSMVMLDIAEAQVRDGRDGFEWGASAWYGGDIHRLWLKTEGEAARGAGVERAEVQALYSRAIGPYFNLQGGLRYDLRPNPSRAYAAIGVEGLAPSFFDVEATLFVSNKGEVMARAEGYYDQRITQRLILQPRAEVNFAAQNSRELGVGGGLSDAELGLRLRYDIKREFAPYVGVQVRQAFGRTRDYLRDAGEDSGGVSLLAGVRLWF